MTISSAKQAELVARDAMFVDEYRKGDTCLVIGERYGVCSGTVSRAIRRAGVRDTADERLARLRKSDRFAKGRRITGAKNAKPLRERFDAMVVKSSDPDDCWGWIGSFQTNGYPQINMDGRNRPGSHASLELDGRPRPGRLMGLHTCDNPPCTNPRHLWWGTHKDNSQDAKAKGRLNLDGLRLGVAARLAKLR